MEIAKEKARAKKEAKANENPIEKLRGVSRDPDAIFFPDVAFKTKKFKTIKDLEDYIRHPHHGIKDWHPAVCYGFTVHNRKRNAYELELFFNDLFVREYQSIPNQKANAINSYQ